METLGIDIAVLGVIGRPVELAVAVATSLAPPVSSEKLRRDEDFLPGSRSPSLRGQSFQIGLP